VIAKQKSIEYEKVIYHIQINMSLTHWDFKHKSMEYEKVMCHVQTDMSLTHCDCKTKEHGIRK
jgi:hypothetical protein